MTDPVVAIKTAGTIHVLRCPLSWLVMDLISWARCTADKMNEAADAAAADSEHIETIVFQDAAAALTKWLENPDEPIVSWPDLRLRQTFFDCVVDAANLDQYVERLLSRGQAVDHGGECVVECLILAEERVVVSTNRLIAKHCGMGFRGELVSTDGLRERMGQIEEQIKIVKTMSEPTIQDAVIPEINALIISRGKTRLVKVPYPLLILNEVHLLSYTIASLRLMSADATADPGNVLAGVTYEQAATDLEIWLDTGCEEILGNFPEIKLRHDFGMPIVSMANIHAYADALIARALPMTGGMDAILSVKCVLNADTLKLSVLSDYCFLATHSGDIQGEIVSAPQMATLTLDAFEGLVDDFLDGDE